MQLKELKQELGGLRVAKVTGGAPNKLSKMCASFAKVLGTVGTPQEPNLTSLGRQRIGTCIPMLGEMRVIVRGWYWKFASECLGTSMNVQRQWCSMVNVYMSGKFSS
jgi:hypothetical protein